MTCRGPWQKMIRIQAGIVSNWLEEYFEELTLEREVCEEGHIFSTLLGLGQLRKDQETSPTSCLSESDTLQPDCK